MNEMRKLMEAVTLLEYLVREGDSIKTLLRLNVFGDTGHLEDKIVYGPNDVSWEEGEIDPELQQEWLREVKPYAKQAGQLKKAIIKAASKRRKLTAAEANAAENTWYDGGDLYDDLELAFDELPGIWDNQIEIVREILAGEVQDDDEGDYAAFDEANQGGKTEHSGAKHGKGAYYGRKKEAKQDSNKNRRKADKAASTVEETVEIIGEAATSRQWEIAINNLIGEGDEKYGLRGPGPAQSAVWQWVRSELHGMLDFQPEGMGKSVELDEGRQFVSSAAMVMWMLGGLERMQLDYNYGGEVEEQFEGVMNAIEDLINEMQGAEIKQYPSRPTHGRRPGRGRDLRRPH